MYQDQLVYCFIMYGKEMTLKKENEKEMGLFLLISYYLLTFGMW